MKIPFLELKPGYLELKDEFDEAYRRVMDSGWYLLGAELEAFESEFAAYVGTKHCVAVGTGLDALCIALRAHGVGAGDEVIVPAHTFIATWLGVTQCGAKPVPVDVRRDTANLDATLLAAALTDRTRAIVPVHLYGQPADMDPINEFAQAHGLVVVEDAAQAHGARYKGRSCGTLGQSAAFSFYPGKNLGAFSDGGAITTDDDEIAHQARRLRNYGSVERYQHELAGTNSRLDELQAAFLRVKLMHLDDWNERRKNHAETFLDGLASTSGLLLPIVTEEVSSSWHLFTVRYPRRDYLLQELAKQGVQAMIHYPIPPHLSGAYAEFGLDEGSFPVAESIAQTVLSLPIGPQLSTLDAQAVVDAVQTATV